MGSNIKAYVETRSKKAVENDSWGFLCDYRFSQNYSLFALMTSAWRFNAYPNPKKLETALDMRGVSRLDDPKLSEEDGVLIMREGCDNGITRGQPSFVEKGVPSDISHETCDRYTFYVVDSDVLIENNTCKRSLADDWLASGRSEVWEKNEDGRPSRVTNPDLHTASWLDADEVQMLVARFRDLLMSDFKLAKKKQAQNIAWAYNDLRSAETAEDGEHVAFFAREIARESDWDTHNPMKEHAYATTEGLAALMNALSAHGLDSRVVFWFNS